MPRYKFHLFICSGKSCSEKSSLDAGPNEAKAFFKAKIKQAGLQDKIRACTSSCLDLCDNGPNFVIYPNEKWISGVKKEDWESIWQEILKNA